MADKLESDERTPIKERLNLHVKKRLQQEQQQYTETANAGLDVGGGNAKKPRKPYQKRTDLVTLGVSSQPSKYQEAPAQHTGAAPSIDACLGQQQQQTKKNRRQKTKKPDGEKGATTVVSQHNATTALTVLTGDEGPDGTPDMNLRSPQGRDKYPDVLGLVLNTKRNALMRDPAVQAFLKQIFDAIRQ